MPATGAIDSVEFFRVTRDFTGAGKRARGTRHLQIEGGEEPYGPPRWLLPNCCCAIGPGAARTVDSIDAGDLRWRRPFDHDGAVRAGTTRAVDPPDAGARPGIQRQQGHQSPNRGRCQKVPVLQILLQSTKYRSASNSAVASCIENTGKGFWAHLPFRAVGNGPGVTDSRID